MAKKPVMNFFEHQAKARSNTKWLVLLFALAVFLIIVALYFVFQGIWWYVEVRNSTKGVPNFTLWDPIRFAGIAGAVSLFIGLASLFKILTLGKGGASVAEMMGGKKISPDTTDLDEKRLLNVVEEMSIASGAVMPDVYVMDNEHGINAFAAGYTPSDAAIAVTRGTLRTLSRDELQGVIAHEFSHIFNGDMRLNIRIMGVLFGILAIGIIGRSMLRGSTYSRSSRKGGQGAVLLVGLAVMLIGYIGTFIGRIIQAAVSRQKEFLADASAVQFTRNPDGIAGALKKIGGFASGSRILTPKAEQASHMFFGQGVKLSLFSGMLATHPPLDERIRRIDPRFSGEFEKVKERARGVAQPAAAAGFAGGDQDIPIAKVVTADPDKIASQIGNPSKDHLAFSAAVLRMLPSTLRDAIIVPQGAVSAVYALLLDDDEAEREKQLEALHGTAAPKNIELAQKLYHQIKDLDSYARLPILDLAMPALRSLAFEDLSRFMVDVENLVAADGKVTLFEFAIQWMLSHRLLRAKKSKGKISFLSFAPLRKDITQLLSSLAIAGHPQDPKAAQHAFNQGVNQITDLKKTGPVFKFEQKPNFAPLSRAMNRLVASSFAIKQKVIEAAAHSAFADKKVTMEEAELLRVVSMALECPLPPFLPTPVNA